MKAILNTKLFRRALMALTGSMSRNQGVTLVFTEAELTMTATGQDLRKRTRHRADIEVPGRIRVPGKLLSDLVHFVDTAEVSVRRERDGLTVEAGKTSVWLEQSEDQEPGSRSYMDEQPIERSKFPRESFFAAIGQVAAAAPRAGAPSPTRGFSLRAEEDDIYIAATDSYRLARRRLVKLNHPSQLDILISISAVNELARVAKGQSGSEELVVDVAGDSIRASLTLGQIGSSRSVDFEVVSWDLGDGFPHFEVLAPEKPRGRFRADTKQLARAVQRSLILGDRTPLRLSFDDSTTMALNSESVASEEELAGSYVGEPLTLLFTSSFLRDGLLAVHTPTVVLEMGADEDPVAIRSFEDDSFLYLLMPATPR